MTLDRLGGRKFALSAAALTFAFLALLVGRMSGESFVAVVGIVSTAYMGANAAGKWADRGR